MSKIINEEHFANYGGINGVGNKSIDTESEEFKALQAVIIAHSKKQTPEQRLKVELYAIKLQMINYLEEEQKEQILTVGFFLKELLTLLKIKNNVFADYIGLSNTNLSAIINDKRKINFDLALKFGNIFKIDSILWINIQNLNEVQEIKKQSGNNYTHYCLADLLEKEKVS